MKPQVSLCYFTVDTVRWVRPDCIMLGCYRLSGDGKEENYITQLIRVNDGNITDVSQHIIFLLYNMI